MKSRCFSSVLCGFLLVATITFSALCSAQTNGVGETVRRLAPLSPTPANENAANAATTNSAANAATNPAPAESANQTVPASNAASNSASGEPATNAASSSRQSVPAGQSNTATNTASSTATTTNAANSTVTEAAPTAAPVAPTAVPLPIQPTPLPATDDQLPELAPTANTVNSATTPGSEVANSTNSETAISRPATSGQADAKSPLWLVGSVVATLGGLFCLFSFAPVFSSLEKPALALGIAGLATAGISQLADAFGGTTGLSLGQWLLCTCGFGGLAASGLLDGNRNRAAAGVLWMVASGLLAHGASHSAGAPGVFSGTLAIIAMLFSVAFCTMLFVPFGRDDATAVPANVSVPVSSLGATAPATVATATPGAKRAPAPAARTKTKTVARLVGTEGTLEGQVFALCEGANSLGRDAAALDGNRLILAGDDEVSRVHALIMCNANRCTLMDAASANGVFLNSARVFDERDLMNGDLVQVGGTTFVYQRG